MTAKENLTKSEVSLIYFQTLMMICIKFINEQVSAWREPIILGEV